MGIRMSQGVGAVGVWLVGALGACALCSCATAEAGAQVPAESDRARAAAPVVTTEPQQVVQRMVPTPAAPVASTAAVSPADVSPADVSPADVSPADVPRRTAEAITSKHLEAELNRLEAELGK
jgi:hypothetical protein